MKFSKLSQLFLVSTIGLLVATYISGCLIVTIDYVYVASSAGSGISSSGQIQVYAADGASGALRLIDKAVSSGGNQPVALAVTSDYANLYVANQSNDMVVHFSIAADGSLTEKDEVNVGSTPVSIAVNTANSYLYVASGTTSATLSEYSLGSGGVIGSLVASESLTVPGFSGDIIVPTAVAVLPNKKGVYVSAYDHSSYDPGCPACLTSSANPGWIFGYAVGSGGALTVAALSPYNAGVKPTALVIDPTNRFLYATDFASNALIGYTFQGGTSLAAMAAGPFKAGNEPSAVTIDPRGIYMYVTNALDSTILGYSIQLSTGIPSSQINNGGTPSTDTDPVAIAVDPALGRFVYTANYLGNSISGLRLDPTTGMLTFDQATPYPSGAYPTALAIIPNGNHATEVVTP